jgi:hypothetical protein
MTPARCGWCITDDHSHCVIVIRMGARADKASGIAKGQPYLWFCPCWCPKSTKCLDCQRFGVDIDENWKCRDQAKCAKYRDSHRGPFKPPKPREDRENVRV